MHVENAWRAPAISPSTELNFVKPPMVDREGVTKCSNDINTYGSAATFNKEQGRQLMHDNTSQNFNYGVGPGLPTERIVISKSVISSASNYRHTVDNAADYNMQSVTPGCTKSQTWSNMLDDTYVSLPSTLRTQKKNSNVH